MRTTNASIYIVENKSFVNFDLGQPISLTCIVDLDTQPANSSNAIVDTDDSVKQLHPKSLLIENESRETGNYKHRQMKRSTDLIAFLPRHLKSLLEVSQNFGYRYTDRKKDISNSFNNMNNDDDDEDEKHFIYWFRNNISLSFTSTSNKDPRITIQDSTIGSKLISHLTIDDSKYSDIGKYECKIITLNLKPANINVLVSNESSDPSSSTTPFELSIVTLIWLNLLSYLLSTLTQLTDVTILRSN